MRLPGARAILALVATVVLVAPGARGQGREAAVGRVRHQHCAASGPVESDRTFLADVVRDRPLFDFGGWLTAGVVGLSNLDHSSAAGDAFTSITSVDLRAWFHWRWTDRVGAYLRLRAQDFGFEGPGVPPDFSRQERPDVDLAFLELPVGRTDVRLGRQLVRVGRGISLSQVLDGVFLGYDERRLEVVAFFARSPSSLISPDFSLVGFTTGIDDRVFSGVQVRRTLNDNARVYLYLWGQNDNTRSLSGAQNAFDFHYHSRYLGLGADAQPSRWTRLTLEYIREAGSSFSDIPVAGRHDIEADAFDVAFYYYPRLPLVPTLSLELAHASGEPNRLSVTSSFGSRTGPATGPDHAFIGFGRIELGLALSPIFTNLDVIRLGLAIKPFDLRPEEPVDVLLGFYYTNYHKGLAAGAISDPGALLPLSFVGGALDAVLAWRASSDISLLAEVGGFAPGAAFPAGSSDRSFRSNLSLTVAF